MQNIIVINITKSLYLHRRKNTNFRSIMNAENYKALQEIGLKFDPMLLV